MEKQYHAISNPDLGKKEETLSMHEVYFNTYTESEVWELFKGGSEVALVNIYKYFYATLYRYGSQFTTDRSLIQDAIQDLFAEIIKSRSRLSKTSSIKFYLFKSLKTTILRLIKQSEKYLKKDVVAQGLEFGMSISQESKIITGQIEHEKKQRLDEVLKKLGPRHREILYYYYFEGLTISEISKLMDFSNEKSAQNLLYKSIKNIKNKLLIISVLLIFIKAF